MPEFFEKDKGKGIRVIQLIRWLDWASGKESEHEHCAIVLPMIQRGSVWKPHQVIDLWDTIFRGMPIGGMMASYISDSKVQFFRLRERDLVTLPECGGLSLIDGQQRTLTMLLAWPGAGEHMNRRIWVDMGEPDKSDHLLRLHVTTESHPFGYQRGGNSGESIARLSLSERRSAAATYADRTEAFQAANKEHSDMPGFVHDADIAPWHSTFALDLRKLIEMYPLHDSQAISTYVHQEMTNVQQRLKERIKKISEEKSYDEPLSKGIAHHLRRRLDAIENIQQCDLERRINTLIQGLERLFSQYFPVIEVTTEMMGTEADDDTKDPPLAVLFKRIGTGGTNLSTADYVFSVIKHRNPNCHNMVEKQLSNVKIASIFTPTTLVMTAVRMTAAQLGLVDHVKLEKSQFTRLLRGDKNTKSDESSGNKFLEEFNQQIAEGGSFVTDLATLLTTISYQKSQFEDTQDVGLPKHALCLVHIHALEIILYWVQKQTSNREVAIQENRHRLVRFILYWNLAVLDPAKASSVCFELLKTGTAGIDGQFPEIELISELAKKERELALLIRKPSYLQQIRHLTHSPSDIGGLRDSKRFVVATDQVNEAERGQLQQAARLYERWWNLHGGYSHILLLWLQRDYVFQAFEEKSAQPGLGDDTPYDFDHICPQSHWSCWTGKKENRLIDFHAETGDGADKLGHNRLGNSIGNLRVWNSSQNRGDGDAAPYVKLKLGSVEAKSILRDSVVSIGAVDGFTDETEAWKDCSFVNGNMPKDPKDWTKERALAFQKAIENRTFNLYKRFYADLRFAEWES